MAGLVPATHDLRFAGLASAAPQIISRTVVFVDRRYKPGDDGRTVVVPGEKSDHGDVN